MLLGSGMDRDVPCLRIEELALSIPGMTLRRVSASWYSTTGQRRVDAINTDNDGSRHRPDGRAETAAGDGCRPCARGYWLKRTHTLMATGPRRRPFLHERRSRLEIATVRVVRLLYTDEQFTQITTPSRRVSSIFGERRAPPRRRRSGHQR